MEYKEDLLLISGSYCFRQGRIESSRAYLLRMRETLDKVQLPGSALQAFGVARSF